jgi:RND family efflux transporter MFP subunit
MSKYLFIVSIVLLFGCKKKEEVKEEQVRPVKAIQVSSASDHFSKGLPSVTQETREVELSFRISGPLIQLNVEEGQAIKKGELIAEVDPRDFKVNLSAKRGRMEQTKAEKDRYNNLYKKGSVSKNEYDLKLAAFIEANSAHENAVNSLKDTKLFAPFNGYIGKKLIENYQDVKAKETILTALDLSHIEVLTHVPENLAIFFPQFTSYKVSFDAYPGKIFEATLKEFGKTPEPAGFPLTLILDYKVGENTDYKIAPGFTCRVDVILDNKPNNESFIIPITAVFEADTDKGASVWVLDKDANTISKKSVQVGSLISNNAIEIRSGITPGEWIVSAGVHQLVEGQKVKQLLDRL